MIELNYQNNFEQLDEVVYSKWLESIVISEGKTIGELSFVFCSDEYLLKINQDHLDHDTYTDIITFDYCLDGLINGEVYISTDRVKENAVSFRESEINELHRVMAHGVLHLCGYGDKSDEEARIMREKENEKIVMFHVKQ
ncbi:rRNA maturation RNase YbeY [Nonlabens xylanidelens]|uniref:Endoribonuclease YbeY n=1 Tax=Nonlabens xylanidelens TaxID=191564 RepID=A0A2S6IRM1_9FLAO|nr:rRNA maturation RNase YbeY [Nonlabens xylanidelens]PPK96686.1 rRNA maturation RNase YbeY [Nonlabens xylanidelens]PQJ13399.1 rRNA maturation RNase YbeY [Nonlabens xylanidelens]